MFKILNNRMSRWVNTAYCMMNGSGFQNDSEPTLISPLPERNIASWHA
jgi:hypothetical protein